LNETSISKFKSKKILHSTLNSARGTKINFSNQEEKNEDNPQEAELEKSQM
jgi:hypothetical protein